MKPYIDFNTQKGKEATDEADKKHFKLLQFLNYAVYGKTMESMRKRIKIRITANEKDFIKYASRPTYIGHKKFGKNLVVIHEKKELLTLNKPIYVGCTVLELSKLEMYKYHYGFMKEKVRNFETLYGDTDSFIYEITGQNFYETMFNNKEFFDLSNFSKDSKYFCNDNKKVPGRMEDEYTGKIIYESEFLKSRIFSLKTVDGNEKSTHKGHNSFIRYDEYKDTRINKKAINNKMRGFKTKEHEIFTYAIDKTSLTNFDDKIHIKNDGIHTLAYGHKDIPK